MNSRRLHCARNRPQLLVVISIVVIGALGCGSNSVEPVFNPGFMVGDWLAEELLFTSVANPQVFTDLVADEGAVFTLSVQPSGRYTAILTGFGQSASEIGKLTVDGADVVLFPESPPGEESRGVWEMVGESVILVSESEFDFNLDGTNEPATFRQVLIPS